MAMNTGSLLETFYEVLPANEASNRSHWKTSPSAHNRRMRQIGQNAPAQPSLVLKGVNFDPARTHQLTGQALAAVATTGILKSLYLFSSHEEMNRHSEHALSIAIAANRRQREHSHH